MRTVTETFLEGYSGSLDDLPEYLLGEIQVSDATHGSDYSPREDIYEELSGASREALTPPPKPPNTNIFPEEERTIIVRYDGEITEVFNNDALNLAAEIPSSLYRIITWNAGMRAGDDGERDSLANAIATLPQDQQYKIKKWFDPLVEPDTDENVTVTIEPFDGILYKSTLKNNLYGKPLPSGNTRRYPDDEIIPPELPKGYKIAYESSNCDNCVFNEAKACQVWQGATIRNSYVCKKWKAI